jgi:hypothetical protein
MGAVLFFLSFFHFKNKKNHQTKVTRFNDALTRNLLSLAGFKKPEYSPTKLVFWGEHKTDHFAISGFRIDANVKQMYK